MVYRGKPSKSCRQCRKRDIKCDKRKESCGQCIRANLICPGYHDQSRTIFTDETESVVRKAHRQPPCVPAPEKLLVQCIEQRAKKLFAAEWVYYKTDRLPYVDHFWLDKPHHMHLAVSIRAVSLAYLSFQLRSPEIQLQARQHYTTALRLTNSALRSQKAARDNATLLTVLLLELYEKFMREFVDNSTPDSKHLDGALTLLQLSGASQFDDAIRLKLFRFASISVLIRCLRRGEDIPTELLSMRETVHATDKDGQLEDLILNFVTLQNGARKGDVLDFEIFLGVRELDDTLLQICLRPPKWKFQDVISGRVSSTELFVNLIEATA